LAAALGIARGHRGQIDLETAAGAGSTFRVWLPAVEKVNADEGLPSIRYLHPPLAGSGTILVIDDEAVVRGTAKSALEHYGYKVLEADSGRHGIQIFERAGAEIAVVLLDLTMPEMSGEETFDQLKRIQPDVPVIVSSGYDEVEASRRFAGKNVAAFLKKPYTAEAVGERIKMVITISQRQMRA